MQNNKAFTLLELIIVILIVGVLASLALPRFFKLIEYTRSTEAIVNLNAIRQAYERCIIMVSAGGGTGTCNSFGMLGIEDPGLSPNAHFTYVVNVGVGAVPGDVLLWIVGTQAAWAFTAVRNTVDGGSTQSSVSLMRNAVKIYLVGTGAFSGITNYSN